MTLPLSLPGVFAGTLLTFIPAAGDFINAQLLGTPRQHMIGNVIQSKFLELIDYPAAASLSFVLMAAIIILVAIYARSLGTEKLTRMTAVIRRHALTAYAICAFIYLLLPIAVVIAFSFNDPLGPLQLHLAGLHPRQLDQLERRARPRGLDGALASRSRRSRASWRRFSER